MEEYIKAGFILRENKRYTLNLPFLESADLVDLDQEVFIREDSAIYQELKAKVFQTETPQYYQCSDSHRGDGLRAKCTDSFQLLLQGGSAIFIDRGAREALCYFGRC